MTWRIENEPGREPNRQMAWGMHTAAAYSLTNGEYVSLTFSRASCSRGRVNSGVLRHQTQQLAGRELGAPTAPLAISSLVFGKSLCTAAEKWPFTTVFPDIYRANCQAFRGSQMMRLPPWKGEMAMAF